MEETQGYADDLLHRFGVALKLTGSPELNKKCFKGDDSRVHLIPSYKSIIRIKSMINFAKLRFQES